MRASDRRFCIAPMMDWMDRHCRFFPVKTEPSIATEFGLLLPDSDGSNQLAASLAGSCRSASTAAAVDPPRGFEAAARRSSNGLFATLNQLFP